MLGRFEKTCGVRVSPPELRWAAAALPGTCGVRVPGARVRVEGPRLSPAWHSRLAALPGALTLLSLLAVLLGTHPPAHEPGTRPTAGAAAPALPELRPTPLPPAPTPLLAAAPPDPVPTPRTERAGPLAAPHRSVPGRKPDLLALGRQQTDGG